VWHVSEVAPLKVVSAYIYRPNLCLVIRRKHEGDERLAHWTGGDDGRKRGSLHRLVRRSGSAFH
jgi:hypothetical protein